MSFKQCCIMQHGQRTATARSSPATGPALSVAPSACAGSDAVGGNAPASEWLRAWRDARSASGAGSAPRRGVPGCEAGRCAAEQLVQLICLDVPCFLTRKLLGMQGPTAFQVRILHLQVPRWPSDKRWRPACRQTGWHGRPPVKARRPARPGAAGRRGAMRAWGCPAPDLPAATARTGAHAAQCMSAGAQAKLGVEPSLSADALQAAWHRGSPVQCSWMPSDVPVPSFHDWQGETKA